MRIAVIGATGMAGSRITAEAARRGHQVTAVARTPRPASDLPLGTTFTVADATRRADLAPVFERVDVAVLATRPAPADENTVTKTTTTVLDAAAEAKLRVIVIGGAGPLHSPRGAGRLAIDDPRYVPEQWRTIAQASVDQLAACRKHDADWTYLSPPALLEPGIRTGQYRRGDTELLVDANGLSRISAEDLAVAVVDEIESPRASIRHFTVAS